MGQKKLSWKSCLFSVRKTGKSPPQVRCRNLFLSLKNSIFTIIFCCSHDGCTRCFLMEHKTTNKLWNSESCCKTELPPSGGLFCLQDICNRRGAKKWTRGKGHIFTLQVFCYLYNHFVVVCIYETKLFNKWTRWALLYASFQQNYYIDSVDDTEYQHRVPEIYSDLRMSF